MIQTKIYSLLKTAEQFLNENSQSIDLEKALSVTQQYLKNLKSSLEPNPEFLAILKNKKNFGTLNDLQDFAKKVLGVQSQFKTRKDVELDIAIKLTYKKIKLETLHPYIKTKQLSEGNKQSISKVKQPQTKKLKITIQDQVKNWMLMKLADVKAELNDLTKYPDLISLKSAGNSILRAEDKRKRKREIIIQIILNRLTEEKSILAMGT